MFAMRLNLTDSSTSPSTADVKCCDSAGASSSCPPVPGAMPINEDCSTSSSSSAASSKSVRFDDGRSQVLEIRHINDFDDDEVAACWFTEDEYREIKKSYQYTLYVHTSGSELTDDMTLRGLEFRTREGFYRRMDKRRDSCTAVLEEQARQWESGDDYDFRYNFDMFSRIYRRFTQKCAVEAAVRGKQDADEAIKVNKLQHKKNGGVNLFSLDRALDDVISERRQQQQQQQSQQPPRSPTRGVSDNNPFGSDAEPPKQTHRGSSVHLL